MGFLLKIFFATCFSFYLTRSAIFKVLCISSKQNVSMKYLPLLMALVFAASCSQPIEIPQKEASAVTYQNPLLMLTEGLKKGRADSTTMWGIDMGLTKDELLDQVSRMDKEVLMKKELPEWSIKNFWQIPLLYYAQSSDEEPLNLLALNTGGDKLDFIVARPIRGSEMPIEEDQQEKDYRYLFVTTQLSLLKNRHGEPHYIASNYAVPKILGGLSSSYHTGVAYLWFIQNKTIALIDVPLNYVVIHAFSPDSYPSPGQMMLIANLFNTPNVYNLWNIPFPERPVSASRLEKGLEDEGFYVGLDKLYDSKYPEFVVERNHPYNSLKFLSIPSGWYIKGLTKQGEPLTEDHRKWNADTKRKLIEKQSAPHYTSDDGKVSYWLHNGYITQFKENDNSLEIAYLQIY
ncbi:hypothetical protein BH09BAC1_BH09BAC1_16320 [soil metagenome]